MTTLGFVVLARFPAPRTEHGWTYTPVTAVFPEPPVHAYESLSARPRVHCTYVLPHDCHVGCGWRERADGYVLAELVPAALGKPAWPDLGGPVRVVDLDAVAERLPVGLAAKEIA